MLDDGTGIGRRKKVQPTIPERAEIVAENYEVGATVANVAQWHGM
jgi:hypothetical protein